MSASNVVAEAHGMTDETWKRHANPWSVWTRFAAIPVFELAVWSRDWIGWWSLAGVGAVLVWLLWLNVRLFGPVEPNSWAARGIYGEKLHFEGKAPAAHRIVLRLLMAAGMLGFALITWGLTALDVWPLILGTAVLVLCQLWRIDRYGLLFEQHQNATQQND
ncbi:DUF6653 family protein [Saccharopolyspora oryzae]|uniref:Transmembrane protein n=1 Tax=Saccharopolyspora oryzae TaxID=2997343 RepID=A0ABT4USK0_9PSEU|nr:DUF6653 family protein [Saccharopolyspora oryzae]MDA3624683.1 hypothetical protein [Saccharopolyspora oryzae]